MEPVVLFFLFGLLGGMIGCHLKLSQSISEFAIVVLLLAIGIKGGMELHEHHFFEILPKILAVGSLGFIIPLLVFPFLTKVGRFKRVDAASIAAHYGSVSVGTFAVCVAFLTSQAVPIEPYAPLFVITLEIPAIIIGLMLAHNHKQIKMSEHFLATLRSQAVTLLLGGLLIGWAAGAESLKSYNFLFIDLFNGFLALFLLDMGFTVSQQLKELKKFGLFIFGFGLVMPLVSGAIAMTIAMAIGLSLGDTVVVTILGASASYIAVPAALRVSLPEANLGLSLGSSLGLTFPFNVMIGIPLAFQVAQYFY